MQRLPITLTLLAQALLIVCVFHSAVRGQQSTRVTQGLAHLYDFTRVEGTLVPDISASGKPLDLRIDYPNGARISNRGVELKSRSTLVATSSASRLVAAIKRSDELTVEAWLEPSNMKQSGPARIVTLSRDSSNRNFTLGQDKQQFDFRLRTTKTSRNGLPSLSCQAAGGGGLTHVVYCRNRGGQARLYVDGQLKSTAEALGNLSNWDSSYKLRFGDEVSGGRSWKGRYRLVAIYHRSLTEKEVERNFQAGPQAATGVSREKRAKDYFASHIAPLFAEHCLECHDAPSKLGGLDLSHRQAALAGGDSGAVIQPGDAQASYLWQTVMNDEMPQDRTPLSAEEKSKLKKWIDDGGKWSMDFIDPVLFVHAVAESETWVQRLTVDEYIATVKAAVGVDIGDEARALLPADQRADGFDNTAYNLNVDFKHVEAYSQLAEIIVDRIDIDAFIRRFAENRRFTDKDMGKLIEKMGKWILRGRLNEQEIIALRGISTTVAGSGGTYEDAVALIIEAMLQSPRFIYRLENHVGDGTLWPVGEYELANRVSYILWGAPPDAELYAAAESGALFNSDKFDAQVQRMLQDPRALSRGKQFISQWLNLKALESLQPNSQLYPEWDPSLAADMRDETLAYFEQVAWIENRPLTDLLHAEVAFLTPELADHYNLQSAVTNRRLGRLNFYDLTSDPMRGGLLTQGSVLTIGGDEASMVSRGLFVLHNLLRGVVRDPPPCVDTTPVPTRPGLTQRMIATARIQNEACGGCHSKFEPLAFGLEQFDGLGTYHVQDQHGNDLREDGKVLFPGEARAVEYDNAKQLMRLLSSNERVRQSLTWKVTQFALGRPLTAADASIVDKIDRMATAAGGSYRDVVTAIVKSDLVQLTQTVASSKGS